MTPESDLSTDWEALTHTWDGDVVARERPYGASVLVWRKPEGARQWLILHRKHHGADYEGEWAWTPPSGARRPGEPLDRCAQRELCEETGLTLRLERTELGSLD